MNDKTKTIGTLLLAVVGVWWFFSPSSEDNRKDRMEAAEWSAKCNLMLAGNQHPKTQGIRSVLTSDTASPKEKKAAVYEACSAHQLRDEFRDYGLTNRYAGVSAERMIRDAHAEAAAANAQIDQAMEEMIADYRKRAKSARSSATAAGRLDTFVMPNGEIVVCKTTFRNGARATTCN